MIKYKDAVGKIHALQNKNMEHLLPRGCIEITDTEADIIIGELCKLTDAEKWQQEMSATDINMPRYIEDIWDVIGIENAPDYTKSAYQNKKVLRGRK